MYEQGIYTGGWTGYPTCHPEEKQTGTVRQSQVFKYERTSI